MREHVKVNLNRVLRHGYVCAGTLVTVLATACVVGCTSDVGGVSVGQGVGPGMDANADSITALAFSNGSRVTTDATWGAIDATLSIGQVKNANAMVSLYYRAAIDDIPCSNVAPSEDEGSVVVLTCSIPPGNGSRKLPKLVVRGLKYSSTGKSSFEEVANGTFEVPVKECDAGSSPSTGERLPRLCRVESGSTALVGRPYEGFFTQGDLDGSPVWATFGFITAEGNYVTWRDDSWLNSGKLTPGEWDTLNGYSYSSTDSIWGNVEGKFGYGGTEGKFVPFSTNSLVSDGVYSVANALAVSISSVAGSWVNDSQDISFAIAVNGEAGQIKGSANNEFREDCLLSGTIRLHEANSAKNLFDVTLTASKAPDSPVEDPCPVPVDTEMNGMAAISVWNSGTELNPVYAHALNFAVYSRDKGVLGGTLRKE